jgi:alpha-galactosidase
MGAHVSAVPNHQIGRVTPLSTRAAVAFFGVLGYELDASALRPEELKEMAEQIEFYKRHRELIQRGRFLRLKSPFEGDGNETAWMCVSHDAGSALVGFYRVLSHPSIAPGLLRLRGLEPRATYRISTWPAADDPMDLHNRGLRGGDELMQAGIILSAELPSGRECRGDYWARLFVLERVRI